MVGKMFPHLVGVFWTRDLGILPDTRDLGVLVDTRDPDGFIGFWDPSRKIRNGKLCKFRGTNVSRSLILVQLVTKTIMKGILNSAAPLIPLFPHLGAEGN